MTDISVKVSGRAKKRTEEDGTVELVSTTIHHTETFTLDEASDFHRIACSKSAVRAGEKLLPDEYTIEREAWDSWDVSVNGNAVEITEFAHAVLEKQDSFETIIDILSLWLENLGSKRIRRAMHSELQNVYEVPVSNVD